MKKIAKLSLCALAGAALASCCTDKAASPGYVSREALASGFVTPPDSIQTSVYWYWISNNISKEGVVKDLESMKKAGINRAFIGNIGQDDVPYGNVKMLSDEWWDVLHTALKKATELDIEIGIFNSPGWSQSGGPWVKPEQAMRYLASSETRVKGPQKVSLKLDKPVDQFQVPTISGTADSLTLTYYHDPMLTLSSLYSVKSSLEKALREQIWLKSGASIVLQHTEALTVIDVNSGKNIIKKEMRENLLRINLEAAKEIAYQLRLRNISGIIIIDFINLLAKEDEAVLLKEFRTYLKDDPVKTDLIDMTRLGLVEVTRKKIKKSLRDSLKMN